MFLKKLSSIMVLCFGVVISEPPVPIPQYGVPLNAGGGGGPINNFGGPNYNYDANDLGTHGDHDHSQAMAYEFGYQVKDDFSGNNYGRQEKSDGNEVRGEYRVQLPDGRIQIVSYYADWQTGFHADVRYEGQQYPGPYNGIPNQYGTPRVDVNQGGFADIAGGVPRGPPGADVGQGSFPEAPGGTRYGAPRVDVSRGGFRDVPIRGQFDGRTPERGYNYNNNGGINTGYAGVNDGISFDDSYRNYNYNRNKPVPVYGAP